MYPINQDLVWCLMLTLMVWWKYAFRAWSKVIVHISVRDHFLHLRLTSVGCTRASHLSVARLHKRTKTRALVWHFEQTNCLSSPQTYQQDALRLLHLSYVRDKRLYKQCIFWERRRAGEEKERKHVPEV